MFETFGTVLNQFEYFLKNSAECSAEDSVFPGLCHMSLVTFPKILQFTEGYMLTIWNSLESVLRLSKKFREMFRGGFRVFQILSFFVKRCSDVPQIHT